jgi:hypothetical protein
MAATTMRTKHSATKEATNRRTVQYRDTAGKTWSARVTGPGAGTAQLNLRVHKGPNRAAWFNVSNVPYRTGMKQTNVWF